VWLWLRLWVCWFWLAAEAVGPGQGESDRALQVGPEAANGKGPERIWAGLSAVDGVQPVAAVAVVQTEAGEGQDAAAVRRVHPALRMAMSLPEATPVGARRAAVGRPIHQAPYT